MKFLKETSVNQTVSILLIIVYLYAAISKVISFSIFKDEISEVWTFDAMSSFIAVSLLFIEFITVALLAIPRWRLKGYYVSSCLMTFFTFYLITINTFSKGLPCSCGGLIEQLTLKQHIAFNCVLILLSVICIPKEINIKTKRKRILASVITVPINT